MWGPGGVGVDVNGDGVSDLRVGHFGQVRPDVGMAYGGMGPTMGYPGMAGMGRGVDLNGDGLSDIRVGPYGQVRPDVGMYAPPQYGPGPYYPPY
jgi:hypothetical protein